MVTPQDIHAGEAEATYRQCKVLGAKVRRLLGSAFEQFARAEH